MKQSQDRPGREEREGPATAETAFDVWLQRGLHRLFDDIANEPIPEELLRLIEEDRSK